jgi:hypothetical protein
MIGVIRRGRSSAMRSWMSSGSTPDSNTDSAAATLRSLAAEITGRTACTAVAAS